MAIHFLAKAIAVKHEEGRVVSLSMFVCFRFCADCKCNQTKVDAQASFDCAGWKCHPAVLIFFNNLVWT